jgi:PAS domain S-box-containing protein
MSSKGSALGGQPDDELSGLISTLHETQQRIFALTEGGVDAVLHPSGSFYLLIDAQAELRLKEAVQRQFATEQAAILDALPAHIALLSSKGIIVTVNEAWRRFARVNVLQGANSAVGQNYIDVCEAANGKYSEEAKQVADGIRSVLGGKVENFSIEYPCHSPSEQRWFRLVVTPVHDDRSGGCVVMHVNITERKLAEDALRASESRLRTIIENEPECVKIASEDGTLLEINPAGMRMLEADDCADVVGRSFIRWVHPDDQFAYKDMHQRAYRGVAGQLQFRVTGLKGGERWAESHSTPLRGADGGIVAVLSAVRDVTTRMQAEGRVKQQAKLLQIAGRTARMGGWLVELSSQRVIWSDEIRVIHEMPLRSSPTLEEALNFYAPEWQNKIRGAFSACVQEGTPFDEEMQIITGKGNLLWVRAIGEAVLDAQGRIAQVQGAFQDISERRRAEQYLRESEERFRQIAENIADVFWIFSPLGEEIIYVSPAYELIWGRSCQELYSNPSQWNECIHERDRPAALEAFKTHSSGEYKAEYRIVRPDGSQRWISARSFPVRDKAGTVCRIVGVATDITATKLSQERLEEQAALLDEAQDAILVTGVDGLVQYWNRSAERIYGWTASEVIGKPIRSLLYSSLADSEKALATVNKNIAVVLESGRWSGQLKQCKKDGSALTAECTFSVLRNDQGKPRAFLGINTDITQRVALEDQHRQLQRLESIGQLTGGIAHDFNNLLTIILGNAELLIESLPDDQQLRPLAETTLAAAERGAELVSRLLAFARRQPLDPKATDIDKLISGMKEMLRRTLGLHADIQLVCGSGLWNALVDTPQLENALLNLCINARDAMPGGGKLTIESTNVDIDQDYVDQSAQVKPGQYVMIAVSDNGVGMPPEVLARAFDPFFTTKDVGKGNGLGLSMVYGFVKQSMGHVKIYSEIGHGTSVRLYLPRATTAADPLKPRFEGTSIPAGSEKVLYVEDDEQISKRVTAQLKSLGYTVVNASNGLEAIDALKCTNDFDLLFTDIMMPGGMNGRQLADRAHELYPTLAVLFSSGFAQWAIVNHGRLDPSTQILPKPFRIGDLARKIRQVLDSVEPAKRAI